MRASQLLTDVRRELIETSAGFWSDAELLRHLNRGQMDFVNRTRLLEDRAFLTTQAGRGDYPLPSNWLSVKAIFHNTPQSDGTPQWQRVHPGSLEKMGQERPNFLNVTTNAQGKPNKYFIWGKTLYLTPAPNTENSSAGDLVLWYKSKPINITDTTTDLEIDDSLAEAVIEYMLWKAWSKEKEVDIATRHMKNYESYVKEGLKWSKRQSGDARNRFDIESNQGFSSGSNGFDPLG